MKCVKMTDGSIQRVKDRQASELINSGKGTFATKKEWRKTDSDWKSRSEALKKFEKVKEEKKKKDEAIVAEA